MIDVSELPDDYAVIDESDRTDRMQNECMVYKLVSFLYNVYESDSAYPDKSAWARVIKERFLIRNYSDCAKRLKYIDGHIKDHFGDDIRYEFKNSDEVILYSINSKFLSIESDDGYVPIKAFHFNKGKSRAIPLENDY